MILFAMFFGMFGGYMGAKTIDYNNCLTGKDYHTKAYCDKHYGVLAGEEKGK